MSDLRYAPGPLPTSRGGGPEEQCDCRSVNANKRHWYKANDRLGLLDRTC